MFSEDGHAVWLNSKALAAVHVTRLRSGSQRRCRRQGRADRRADRPRQGWVLSRWSLAPCHSPRAKNALAPLRLAIRDAQEHGVTSVQDIESSAADFDVYADARREGDLTVRVYASLPISSPGALANLTTLDDLAKRYADDALFSQGGPGRASLDGSVESQTAATLVPYVTRGQTSGT